MAFVITEGGQPLGDPLTAHATNIPSCITYPGVEEGFAFEIKQHMLNILPTFHRFSTEDPNMHIAEFLMGCKNILVRGFSTESIKLRLFPYTLKDQARRWLLTLPSGSISTWNQLNEKFLSKYYLASKTPDMRTQILSFAQKPNEEFHEAWERFKELIRKCPHYGINSIDQMHIFFRGLNMTTKTLVNASCGGSHKDKNAQEACLLFEKMAVDTRFTGYCTAALTSCLQYLQYDNPYFLSCPHKAAYPEFAAEQVDAFNNFRRLRNDLYSNFYNPGWRDHPNLKWDRDQHAKPQFQQQIALQVSKRASGTFPRKTVPNPRGREECNAIWTLRSGKSYDNRHENCPENSQAAPQPQIDLRNFAKSNIFVDSVVSANSGQPQDRSENTAEATTKTAKRVYVPPMPYPGRLRPKAKDQQLTDFMKTLAKVQINLPLIYAIKNIPSYTKFLKDVCTKKKKLLDFEKVILTEYCSAVLLHKLPPKKKDLGSFTISCTIGNCDFSSALIDLGASVNLMPYSVFKRLGEGELKTTSSIIQLVGHSITYPRGVIEDVIVKVDNLYLPVDFMVLDMDEDLTAPIILGHPFLATARTLIDVEAGTLTFRVEDETVVFRLFEATTLPGDKQECMRVDALDGRQESRWKGLYMVMQVFHNGNVDIEKEGRGCVLKVKKYLLKPCIGKFGASKSLTLKEPVI
ncbi:uncharacterized protein LOC125472733 [Pyrus x bretschneideri]|uniref:uncharacterized protein LOC125472733 n=1 Tax=Pyrus x bretschneideri TaxID=225117 RepID=UPI00202FFCA9|nr:uncharacterized protein LOC125472733 [Pyrus x bretschneideri]